MYNKIEEGRVPRGIRPSSHIFTKFMHCPSTSNRNTLDTILQI